MSFKKNDHTTAQYLANDAVLALRGYNWDPTDPPNMRIRIVVDDGHPDRVQCELLLPPGRRVIGPLQRTALKLAEPVSNWDAEFEAQIAAYNAKRS